jgi:hypothetical protein
MNTLKFSLKRFGGFTMAEAMVSVALLGTLAALLLPVLYTNVGKDKLMSIGKTGVAELVAGYNTYSKTRMPDATTTAATLVGRMSVMRIFTNGVVALDGTCTGQCIQVADVNNAPTNSGHTNSDNVYVSPCNNTTPCALLQSGALLQYDGNATFNGTGTTNALRFLLDTDGTGIQNAVPLVLYLNGRVSTVRWATAGSSPAVFDNSAGHPDNLPNGNSDPEFILDWTDG